jgi:hypothetical protein
MARKNEVERKRCGEKEMLSKSEMERECKYIF